MRESFDDRLPVPRRGAYARVTWCLVLLACVAAVWVDTRAQESPGLAATSVAAVRLTPTVHPPVPASPTDFWFVPEASSRAPGPAEAAVQRFARAVALVDDGKFAAALPLITSSDLSRTPLADYSRYYRALALAGLDRAQEAQAALEALLANHPDGYLNEAASMRLAEMLLRGQGARRALLMLEDLRGEKGLTSPDDVWLALARAADAAGEPARAIEAYRQVYYGSPLSLQAVDAQNGLKRLDTSTLSDRLALELARAERLFAARRWAQARAGFAPLAPLATDDDKALVSLRLAECDFRLGRFRASRDAIEPFLVRSPREAEARYFYLSTSREVRDVPAYLVQARALIDDFPDSTWAADTLNDLASYHVKLDDDAAADLVFRELALRFPTSRYTERAAWKIGWLAYKNGDFAEAVRAFEKGAAAFPRADTRPAWLYWAGRAHDQLGETAVANERYRVEVADYQNSYYGRLAWKLLEARRALPVGDHVAVASATVGLRIPTATLIQELLRAELYDAALEELQYAQRAWGDLPAIGATVAWVRHAQAPNEMAPERFEHLRGGINAMKRAYPQYLAAGGERLPAAVLEVIFPLDYWPLIKKYSDEKGLDPFLMAALIAQESTFTADVRSSANAWGLMQLMPATGRRYARKVGIRPFSTASLKKPETNIRLGMTYFKDLMARFGGAHFALASYNAGEGRVQRWLNERPDFAQDEFIDDIPFPETQNYVKRILGTAEDYRRLYGGGLRAPSSLAAAEPASSSGALSRRPGEPVPARPPTRSTR